MTSPSAVPTVRLNDGVEIPQLGFGVFQIEPGDTVEAVSRALEVGYRHIDTAEMYGNEAEVGRAVRESGIPRSEIFITSKLNNGYHRHDDALRAFDETMSKLGLDQLDLFLVHWPLPTIGIDYVETWRALEKVKAEGRVRSIGVSNFQAAHLDRLAAETSTVPSIDQIECHPYLTQEPLRAHLAEHGIACEAWSPIAQGGVLGDEVITRIAGEVGRSPAQVTLRWHVQLGNIVFPKSVTPERIRENFSLWDFELSDEQVAAISALNRDERTGPDPDTFDYIPA